MSRKGLSLEEKRKRLEQVFHESSEFYNLKELEKIGPKKGIVSQSVKDVLQSLVDDGLVTTDKIANSNYYWSFPSTAVQTKRRKLDDLRKQVEEEKAKRAKQEGALQAAQAGREQSDERKDILEQLQNAKDEQRALLAELQKYKDNDPEIHHMKAKAAAIAKEAANRWTENIWIMESYCANKFNIDRKVFQKEFGIPDDLDTFS